MAIPSPRSASATSCSIRDTHLGDYTLPVDARPTRALRRHRTTGDLAFDAEHVETLARFKRGELYDSRKVDDLRQALVATGLFATVAVEPQTTGETAGDGTEYVTMLVTQDAGPPRTLAASAGYGTGAGLPPRGQLDPPQPVPARRRADRPRGCRHPGAGRRRHLPPLERRQARPDLPGRSPRRSHSNYDAFDALTGRLCDAVELRQHADLAQRHSPGRSAPKFSARSRRITTSTLAQRDKRKYLIGGLSGQVGIDRTDSLLESDQGLSRQLAGPARRRR